MAAASSDMMGSANAGEAAKGDTPEEAEEFDGGRVADTLNERVMHRCCRCGYGSMQYSLYA